MRSTLLKVMALMSAATLSVTSCSGIVIKVNKTPRPVDTSSLSSSDSLKLAENQDFLQHLDQLKTIAVDLLVKQLAKKDYVGEFRTAVRKYRKHLIDIAHKDVLISDSFYSDDAQQCRKASLSLNMDENDQFLGLILKTVALAKLSEVGAGKLNPGIQKELSAIVQIITMELGLKIDGETTTEEVNGKTIIKGKASLRLVAIAGEKVDGQPVDAATIASDKDEVLTMEYERALGDEYTGTFTALIQLTHRVSAETLETVEAKFNIERVKDEDYFSHVAVFTAGVQGQDPGYSRKLIIEQQKSDKNKFKVTDIMNFGRSTESSHTTIIDVKNLEQCKISGDYHDGDGDGDGKGNEQEPKGVDPTPTVTPSPTPSASPTPTATPAPGGNDSDGKGGKDGPAQNPKQNPNQTPKK